MTNSPGSGPDASAPQRTHGATAPQPRNPWKRAFLGLLAIGATVGWWVYSGSGWARDDREALPPEVMAEPAPRSGIMVTAEPVVFRSLQRSLEAVGTLYGYEEIVISSKVEGRVHRLCSEVSDRVRPGNCVLEIDPVDFQLAVEQAQGNLEVELAKLGLQALPDESFEIKNVPTVMLAQAQVDNAQAKYDRLKRLAAENATTSSQLDTALSELNIALADHANQVLMAKSSVATVKLRRSALAVAEQQLADARILAPQLYRPVPGMEGGVSYVVTSRSVSDGTFVKKGDEICRLAVDQTLKLRIPVPERHSDQIKLGQTADVLTAAYRDPFPGVVTLINPSVDAKTRTFNVEVQVANDAGRLKPGSFAKATVHTTQSTDSATVPHSALVTFAGVTKLFLSEGGQAREVLVEPGMQTRDWVEIASPPLGRDAVVITSGQSALANMTAVTIRTESASDASDAVPRRPTTVMADSQDAEQAP
ncbi:Multidrug resistance protein MdtA precursor [Caulifigura coniformis]|uniref:Multidrug resistance protein MdtA n=1 Tax=Caulifigura coniformis TaxID=2527983 RepID=A0A517SDS1_9PLAN|nr:efflux RND transporter periplasmic adaptor subunit [Caulifigura coniformis]QDT54269.1 Multidrug resistance protein MdtA precursor [Caulifigura coniformis]